ncbi:hypothetical protein C5167_029780 [Papaver somniferum]|nr:hypothetical protein C5167_029780 [Papaver somniferum]
MPMPCYFLSQRCCSECSIILRLLMYEYFYFYCVMAHFGVTL